MNFDKLKKQTNKFIAETYGRFDTAIEKGKGAECVDFDGKKYIDFTSGIGVNSLGFCDTDWARAVARQAKKLNHASNLYYTQPMADAAKLLCKKTGYENLFFANSGAEANEGAIKTARKYSQEKYGEYKTEIITLVNSFHGRTVTTLAATGQEVFHEKFLPLTEGFVYAKANDFEDVQDKVSRNTAAIMVE
ncbi:MAG: aminotransferase class III-fold pyridoxal phosphate-dependent enzyme, partial [Oscillospiraceae bacterium]